LTASQRQTKYTNQCFTGKIDLNNKIKKKDPCPCESGKRYEQCCRKKKMLFHQAQKIFAEKEARHHTFIEQYGHIRIPQMIDVWGGKVIMIGGSIFKQTRPCNYTFIHAVHDYALHLFSEEYLIKQESMPTEKRHPALQWMYTYVDEENSKNPRRTGAGATWLRFAYDIHTISDNATLEAKLKERLLKYKSFQTARHELWTAALFITAGFEINFVDETDSTMKHPEFIAIDKESGIEVAVEAKCRQRKGVLGFADGSDNPLGEDVGITRLLKKAYKKEDDLPLCIVINTNLPPENKNWNMEYWQAQIGESLKNLARNGYENPCPANLILFFNDPSHQMVDEEIGKEEDSLWLIDCFPVYPKNECDEFDGFRKRLLKAQIQRLHPPLEIPNI
jgi:hypothetical protein